MSNVSISTNNLTIGYIANSQKPIANSPKIVQSSLTFSLNAGEMVCMLGPNGCGKSTLLRTLAGLQPALSGEYNLTTNDQRPTAKNIALVLTERLSLENTTVHDVVAMGRYPYTSFLGGLTPEDETIIADALAKVGFKDSTLNPPTSLNSKLSIPSDRALGQRTLNSQLSIPSDRALGQRTLNSFFNAHSDGEKQRILIAKALAQQTPIILLDEPTAHLDLPHRILILRLLRTLAHEQGKTILISTHELDLALALSDRILLMTPGRGIRLDTADNLRRTDAFTSAFGMDIFNPLGQEVK